MQGVTPILHKATMVIVLIMTTLATAPILIAQATPLTAIHPTAQATLTAIHLTAIGTTTLYPTAIHRTAQATTLTATIIIVTAHTLTATATITATAATTTAIHLQAATLVILKEMPHKSQCKPFPLQMKFHGKLWTIQLHYRCVMQAEVITAPIISLIIN